MRAYFFGNMYLSSIQQGIQSQHCTADMFVRYQGEGVKKDILFDWATNHKTSILLNAGFSSEIRDLFQMFNSGTNPYPWEGFCEGEDALDSAMTCIGIILPERIYNLAAMVRTRKIAPYIIETYTGSDQKTDDATVNIAMALEQISEDDGPDYEQEVAQLIPFERDLIIRLPKYGMAS
jgi:hypothetical protein